MKVAIPMAEGRLTAHFGHCQQFAMVTVEDNRITDTALLTPPPHEPGVLPQWLHAQGATLVIAGGMGARAIGLLQQNGIQVITGAPSLTPEELVTSYLNDTLETGGNLCDH